MHVQEMVHRIDKQATALANQRRRMSAEFDELEAKAKADREAAVAACNKMQEERDDLKATLYKLERERDSWKAAAKDQERITLELGAQRDALRAPWSCEVIQAESGGSKDLSQNEGRRKR